MTAKTTCLPAPAPSVASETARQLASFAHSHFAPQRAAQVLVERFPVQPCGVGVLHQAGFRGNGSGIPIPTLAAPAEFLLDSFRSVRHRAHRTFVIKALAWRCGGGCSSLPFSFERHEFNLGAAEIHANSNLLLFFLSGRHRFEPPIGRGRSLSCKAQFWMVMSSEFSSKCVSPGAARYSSYMRQMFVRENDDERDKNEGHQDEGCCPSFETRSHSEGRPISRGQ